MENGFSVNTVISAGKMSARRLSPLSLYSAVTALHSNYFGNLF